MFKTYINKVDCRIWAMLASILLSIIILNTYNPPIEIDGLTYIQTAQVFIHHGLHAALTIFDWPLYSICMAWLSQLLHISLEHAGYVLDSLGSLIGVFAFVTITKELGADKKTQWIAAAVILTYPTLNILRKTPVLRDFMYWGLLLLALMFIIKFARSQKWHDAILWGIAMIAASLFRTEGGIILLLLPFVFLLTKNLPIKQRLRIFGKAYLIPGIIIIGTIIFFLFHHQANSTHPNRIMALIKPTLSIYQNYQQKSTQLESFLNPSHGILHLRHFGILVIMLMLASLMAVMILINTQIIYTLIYFHGIKQTQNNRNIFAKKLVHGFIIINLIICFIFLSSNMFLSKRYILGSILGMLLFAPFSLSKLANDWKSSRGRIWLFPLVLIILALFAVAGLYRGFISQAYITDAGQWINQHTNKQAVILSNDHIIFHYAERAGTNDIKNLSPNAKTFSHYQYIVILAKNHHNETTSRWLTALGKPIKVFSSTRHDHAYIYKINHTQLTN